MGTPRPRQCRHSSARPQEDATRIPVTSTKGTIGSPRTPRARFKSTPELKSETTNNLRKDPLLGHRIARKKTRFSGTESHEKTRLLGTQPEPLCQTHAGYLTIR